jgi:hypothetical protein
LARGFVPRARGFVPSARGLMPRAFSVVPSDRASDCVRRRRSFRMIQLSLSLVCVFHVLFAQHATIDFSVCRPTLRGGVCVYTHTDTSIASVGYTQRDMVVKMLVIWW